jgi:hypothetical protein
MNLKPIREAATHLKPSNLRQHPLMSDPISVATLVVSVLINILNLALLVLKIHRVDYPVPVHYQSLIGFDQVGGWYQNYRLALFAIIVTIVNGLLAAKSFQRNRLGSFFLLLGAAVVSILCLVISSAFAVIT